MDFRINVVGKATLLSVVLVMFNFVYSGSWFPVYEDSTAGNVRAVRSMGTDFWKMIGVGDNGRFYKFESGAHSLLWEVVAAENFNDLDFWYDFQVSDTTIIVAGNGGAVFRQNSQLGGWIPVSGIDAVNYNSVFYDFSAGIWGNGVFYIAGDQGNLWFSNDKGVGWTRVAVGDNQHRFIKVLSDLSNTYLISVRNDSTHFFSRNFDVNFDSFTQMSYSIPDFEPVTARFIKNDLSYEDLYLAGRRVSDGRPVVWMLPNAGFLEPPVFMSEEIEQDIVDIDGYFNFEDSKMWVTTVQGVIWESDNQGMNWRPIYNDPNNRRLGPIHLNTNESAEVDRGRIFGDFGLILKYGFEIQYFDPYINSQVDYNLNQVSIKFSGIPDESRLPDHINITSSISGNIPFTPELDMTDPSMIFLNMERSNGGGTIPGERYSVSISDSLQDQNGATLDAYGGLGFSFDIMPFGRSDFDFKGAGVLENLGIPATRPVVGLINNDDTFDCVFWARDTLYCLTEDQIDFQFRTVSKVPMPSTVAVNAGMKEQLALTDINLDGFIDIILYDSRLMTVFLNRSTGQEFSFEPSIEKQTSNTRKIVPINANNNKLVDLLILGDSLYTQLDITETGFGNWVNVSAFPAFSYGDVVTGDINHDGRVDLALIDYRTETGAVTLMSGTGDGNFSEMISTPDNGYSRVALADMDKDNTLELVAYYSNQIDIYKLIDSGDWNLQLYPAYSLPGAIDGSIVDVMVHDFGAGNPGNNMPPAMDIIVLVSDSIRILENVSQGQGDIGFIERMDKRIPISYNDYDDVLYADYNKDGQLDFTIFDRDFGTVELFFKSVWKPMIERVEPHKYTAYLQWAPLPAEYGILDYYRIVRDTTPQFNEWSYQRESATNSFVDTLWEQYSTFWYAVQAVYNGGLESAWSDPVSVQNFIELNGNISGELIDSTRIYYAATDLTIPAGETLVLGPGIDIGFADGTALNVIGGLEIQGNSIDRGMVELHSVRDEDGSWRGVQFYSSPDTVKFTWFSIYGAQTGIKAFDRPIQLQLGGIEACDLGIDFFGDTLSISNVVIDSNLTGIKIGNGSGVDFRNMNVIFNQNEGLNVSGDARVRIKNAVMSGNGGPAIISQVSSPAQLSIRYSTVDSIEGIYSGEFISQAPPVFMPSDSGHYRQEYSSPAIDRGDPADDFSMEPLPNGGRINQGLFGGTQFATITLGPRVHARPAIVKREVNPNSTDTVAVWLYSMGGAPVNVNQIGLSNNSPVFTLPSTAPFQIPPEDSARVVIAIRPVQRGVFRDTLVIRSDDNLYPKGILRIPLEGIGLNSAPVLGEVPLRLAFTELMYIGNINAKDPDGDSLSYVPLMLPAWLNLNNSALSGVPGVSDTGKVLVRVNILDGFGANTILNYFITVREKSVTGEAPVMRITTPAKKEFLQSLIKINFNLLSNIGTTEDSLRIRYTMSNITNMNTLQISDTVFINSVSFYPVEDGAYLFKVWAYDMEGNGFNGERADSIYFTVRASKRMVKRYRWYMTAFPRPQDINWYDFNYSDSSAIIYTWDNDKEDYVHVNRKQIDMGSGFWILSNDTMSFDLSAYEHHDWHTDGPALTRRIRKGWNQIGVPLSYAVNWSDMKFISDSLEQTLPLLDAIDQGQLQGAVFWFMQTGKLQGYRLVELDSTAIAGPWLAYWLKSETDGMIEFSTEPYLGDDISADVVAVNKVAGTNTSFDNWRLSLDLRNGEYEDGGNILGVSAQKYGLLEDPPPFGDYCALSFISDGKKISRLIKDPLVHADEVHEWRIDVETKTAGQRHFLKWDNTSIKSGLVTLYLVDQKRELIINMAEEEEYNFVPNGAKYQLKVYASRDMDYKPEIIPLSYKLGQNYPNPFNPSTTIRFGVPENHNNERVRIRIYDVLGREIIKLADQRFDPGYHSVVWDGLNSTGRRVATGIYFYQLISGKSSVIKKMILMK